MARTLNTNVNLTKEAPEVSACRTNLRGFAYVEPMERVLDLGLLPASRPHAGPRFASASTAARLGVAPIPRLIRECSRRSFTIAAHSRARSIGLYAERVVRTPASRSDSIAVVKVIPATPQAEYKLREPVGASRDGDRQRRESISPAQSNQEDRCRVLRRATTGGATCPCCR